MYSFTQTDAAVLAAARMGVQRLGETGRLPRGATYENIPAIARDAIKADMEAIAQTMAPVIAYDVFMEVRSALQRLVWAPDADPLTDEQTELWEDVTSTLADLNTKITTGGRP